jgi:hypothetical protein
MSYPEIKCPECESTGVAVEVKTWMNFFDGKPEGYDEADTDSAEPIVGGACVCRECQHQWKFSAP